MGAILVIIAATKKSLKQLAAIMQSHFVDKKVAS